MTAGELNVGQPGSGLPIQRAGYATDLHRTRARGSGVEFACLGAALAAQLLLDRRALFVEWLPDVGPWLPWAAGIFYGLAAILWARRHGHRALEAPAFSGAVESPLSLRRLGFPLALAGAAVLLGVLASARFTGNQFTRDGTLLWLLGLAVLAVAAWLVASRKEPSASGAFHILSVDSRGVRLGWYQVGLLLVMAVGAFYRLYRINIIPLEMGPDLSHNYSNIRQILIGEYPIFFTSHPGREALFFYLAAPFCRIFGLNHTNIKIVASLVGLATLPVVYLLGKELYDREVGLAAAFFLGIGRWHIILGRVGYRATLVPLMVALTWYFLLRGLKTGRAWFYALSGFSLGLGMYTYNAFMAAPLVVAAVILVQILAGRGRRVLGHAPQVLLLFVVAAYVFIPLGRYAMESPGEYLYRAATRVTSLEQPLPANMLPVFLSNVARALGMFNVQGDPVFVANVPYERELGFLTATLFVLGLAYVLWRWRAGYNATLPVVGMGMLLPSTMALAFPHEVPNAIRAIGVIPVAALLPGVALVALRRRVATLLPTCPPALAPCEASPTVGPARRDEAAITEPGWQGRPLRILLVVIAVAALGIEAWSVYPFYFRDYVRHLAGLNYSISLQLARAIDAFADDGQSYIKVFPYWYDGNAVRAQLRRADPGWSNELETLDPGRPPLAGPAGKYMVVVHPDDQASLQALRRAFDRSIELVNLDNTGKIAFITFYGER